MKTTARRIALTAAVAALAATAALPGPAAGNVGDAFGRARLLRFAQLPARSFVSGSEPSGALLGTAPINGITPPFADQPVQGFSGVLRNSDGTFDVLSDNGYGAKNNSADFILRIQRIAPDFDQGTVDVVGGINLTDPDGKVPFALTRPDRVLDALAQEIRLMLDEGVVAAAQDIDLCLILGAGWPFHLGGITPYLDRSGIAEKVNGRPFLPAGLASLSKGVASLS